MTTTTTHVLGHLAQRFAISEENIASEALIWILQQSPAAKSAIASLALSVGVELPAEDLNYVGQVGKVDTGRPDVVGRDKSGLERLLIEAKFAAQLTAKQPKSYLDRLSPDIPGLLLVVVPNIRMTSLWLELLSALPDQLISALPDPSADLHTSVESVHIDEHRVLAIVTWRHLVSTVLGALRNSGEYALAQDAEQLLALTETMDNSAYSPVRPGDYGARSARQIQQLQLLIDDAHTAAMEGDILKNAGIPSHGRIFYGWYLRSAKSLQLIWFGFLPRAWDRYAKSPLWMRVNVNDSWSHQSLSHALASFNVPGEPGVFDEQSGFFIPLIIRPFASQKEAVISLVDQLESVAAALDFAMPSDSTPLFENADQTLLDADLAVAEVPI